MNAGAIILILVVVAFVIIAISKKKSQPKGLFGPDFEKRMDDAQKKRDIIVKYARTQDDDYGYSPTNPIMESSVHTSYIFLDRLRTEDGKAVTYDRTGALMMTLGGQDTMVDEYVLSVDGKEFKKIYICGYGHALGIAPKGLTLAPRN